MIWGRHNILFYEYYQIETVDKMIRGSHICIKTKQENHFIDVSNSIYNFLSVSVFYYQAFNSNH